MILHRNSDNHTQRSPFFVIGSSRSGTTMFRLMLNTHPRLLIPGETWFLGDLMDRLPLQTPLSDGQVQMALSIVRDHWRWSEWGLDDDELATCVHGLRDPTLSDVIRAIYSLPLAASGKSRWGDKTPGYLTEIARLHQVMPEARFLHVIRDGRDVCLSLKRTGWHGETTWQIARYWGDAVLQACTAGRMLPADRYLEVRYEDLVLATETTLRNVCTFLEEEFRPVMLQFFETAGENIPDRAESHLTKTFRPPRATDVQRWKREMTARQTLIFEAFAGQTLEAAGYERRHKKGLPAVRAACRGLEWAAETSLPVRRKLGLHFPRLRRSL